jgi:hypothetical protein
MYSNETKKDPVRINRDEHDSKFNAKRCRIVGSEFDLKLDHQDDSVTAHPNTLSVSSIGVKNDDKEVIPALYCSSLKRVQLYIETASGLRDCTLVVQVSPVDSGDVWFNLFSLTKDSKYSKIEDICARRIRVIQSKSNTVSELNVHLVGQG